ncbi:hypothetical protein KEJ51_03730, partial [Candidatus Bathyarchaeota archaeon]|nr:hypothetical protein [Candidatus Bathyarchaeota archaeon]
CPIMVSDAKIFEPLNEQVVKYPARDLEKFKSRLIQVLTDRDLLDALKRTVRKCIEENSASKIAERYLTLFLALKKARPDKPSTYPIPNCKDADGRFAPRR